MYMFTTLLALVASVLCTRYVIMNYVENDSIDWFMLILGIVNAIFFVVDFKDYLIK